MLKTNRRVLLGKGKSQLFDKVNGAAAAAPPAFSDTKCISFASASSQYLTVNNDASLNITGNLSISAWIKCSAAADAMGIVNKADYGTTTRQYYMFVDFAPNQTKFGAIVSKDGAVTKYYRTSAAVATGAWVHVAFTYSSAGNGTLKLYVNGAEDSVSVSNNNMSTLTTSTNPLLIGAIQGNGVPGYYMNGKIDEVSIWSATLSATDITNIYNSGHPADLSLHAQYANLVSWWRMGDLTDAISSFGILDRKGSNNADPKNAPTISTDAP